MSAIGKNVALMLIKRALEIARESEHTPHASIQKQTDAWHNVAVMLDIAHGILTEKKPRGRNGGVVSGAAAIESDSPFTDSLRRALGGKYEAPSIERSRPTVCPHGVPLGMECELCLSE